MQIMLTLGVLKNFYCQLCFRYNLHKWSLQLGNVILSHPVASNFKYLLSSLGTNKKGNWKYMGIQSWQ